METLVLDGKTYVKASKAARDLGYATDYVGQLCRGGKVDAHLVGRTWYVNPEVLGSHRVEKKRMSRVKAREHARKTIEEYRTLKTTSATNSHKNIDIRYDTDVAELMPEIKKLHIKSDVTASRATVDPHEPVKTFEIQNEGSKVIMSGDLTVQDVDDESTNPEVTMLTPQILKRAHTKQKSFSQELEKPDTLGVHEGEGKKLNFIDRLAEQTDEDPEAVTIGIEAETTVELEQPQEQYQKRERTRKSSLVGGIVWYCGVLSMSIALAILAASLVEVSVFSRNSDGGSAARSPRYQIDTASVISFIHSQI